MKILLGIPEYPPNYIGGGGEVYKNLAENYRKLGHDVVVIFGYYPTKSWHEKIIEYSNNSGIKFYQIPEIPYPKSMPFLRSAMPPNLGAWRQLKTIIQKENPDVAHLHGYGLIFVNILAKILRKLKIKYIFTIHGYPESQNKSNKLIRIIWNIYIKMIMNKTLRFAKKITCVSSYIKEDERNIFPKKSVVIYNGINFSDFEKTKRKIDVIKKHNILPNTKIILSIGRITEMKGFQEMINLIPKFLEKEVNIKYLIAGEDEGYKKELEKLAFDLDVKENVEFIGFLDLATKKQYLKQCDIFAIPSLWEPFGLVALEAIIYNKTIITSGAGGLKEILKNYKNWILISDESIVEKALTKDSEPLDRNALEKFNYNTISKSYLNLLKRYVKRDSN